MIKHYPYETLGKAEHGWLKSSHHFSFAHYYNPQRMGFGTLRVINDDWVEPGSGFPPHPHNNMEIISFIRSGQIAHQDSVGNKGLTEAGEVQVMSAGTGVVHSEYNLSEDPLTFYQIWITPNKQNVTPRWEAKQFPQEMSDNHLPMLVSGYEEDIGNALFIHQEARIFGGKLSKGATLEHDITHQAYVLASDGEIEVRSNQQSVVLAKGDGAEVTDLSSVTIKALDNSEVLVIDAPER